LELPVAQFPDDKSYVGKSVVRNISPLSLDCGYLTESEMGLGQTDQLQLPTEVATANRNCNYINAKREMNMKKTWPKHNT